MYSQDDELMQAILNRGQKKQGILDRVKQNVTNPQADNVYKAGMTLFGGKQEQDGASRLADQMALMQFKSTLPGNDKPNFLLDDKGQVVPLPSGRIVQRPFGFSDEAQQRHDDRIKQSGANRDTTLLQSGYGKPGEDINRPTIGDETVEFKPELLSQKTSAQEAGKIGVENVQNLNEYMANANKVLTDLDQLEKQSESLGDFEPGIGQIWDKTLMKYKELTEDPTVANYMGTLTEKVGPIARTLQEEKGPLTENDVQRAITSLGNKTAPLSVKKERINSMRDKIRRAIEVKRQIAEKSLKNPYDVQGSSQITSSGVDNFSNMSDDDLKRIAGI